MARRIILRLKCLQKKVSQFTDKLRRIHSTMLVSSPNPWRNLILIYISNIQIEQESEEKIELFDEEENWKTGL